MNKHAYYYRDHAHRYASRHNSKAWDEAEHGSVNREGLGFDGGFKIVPPSPRPKCDPDQIKALRNARWSVRYGPTHAMAYGELLQKVVSPVMLP